jgi:hypothetical protein
MTQAEIYRVAHVFFTSVMSLNVVLDTCTSFTLKHVDLSSAVHVSNPVNRHGELSRVQHEQLYRVCSPVIFTWTALDKFRCLRREHGHENSVDCSHVSFTYNHRGNFPGFTWEVYTNPLDVSSGPIASRITYFHVLLHM